MRVTYSCLRLEGKPRPNIWNVVLARSDEKSLSPKRWSTQYAHWNESYTRDLDRGTTVDKGHEYVYDLRLHSIVR